MRWCAFRLSLLLLTLLPAPATAQTFNAARLAILQAEDRRAPTAADLATIRAGLPGVTAHVLRHTAATWMAQRGVSLERIGAYLGNSAATVERVYAHHHPAYMAEASAALDDET